jgi:hypothetical protein
MGGYLAIIFIFRKYRRGYLTLYPRRTFLTTILLYRIVFLRFYPGLTGLISTKLSEPDKMDKGKIRWLVLGQLAKGNPL